MLKSHKHAGHSLGPSLIHKEMFEYIYRLRSIYSIQYIIVFLRTCSVSQKVWHVSLSHLMSSLKPASARLIPATTIYVTFSNSGSIGVGTDCPQMQPNLPDSAQPGKSCKCQPVVVFGRLKMTVQCTAQASPSTQIHNTLGPSAYVGALVSLCSCCLFYEINASWTYQHALFWLAHARANLACCGRQGSMDLKTKGSVGFIALLVTACGWRVLVTSFTGLLISE